MIWDSLLVGMLCQLNCFKKLITEKFITVPLQWLCQFYELTVFPFPQLYAFEYMNTNTDCTDLIQNDILSEIMCMLYIILLAQLNLLNGSIFKGLHATSAHRSTFHKKIKKSFLWDCGQALSTNELISQHLFYYTWTTSLCFTLYIQGHMSVSVHSCLWQGVWACLEVETFKPKPGTLGYKPVTFKSNQGGWWLNVWLPKIY